MAIETCSDMVVAATDAAATAHSELAAAVALVFVVNKDCKLAGG